jgi:hypothetical protein
MSFRRPLNTHDRWLDYCQRHQGAVHSTGLPTELFRRADVLEDFLEHGHFRAREGKDAVLSDISDAAFLALEEVVNGYFDFQQGYPSFCQERLRRFQRYG